MTPARHTSDAGCFASDLERDRLMTIELAGKAGRRGRDGQSYHAAPAGFGRKGQNGGHASEAEDGRDGTDLELQLAYAHGQHDSGEIAVSGQLVRHGVSAGNLSDRVEIGTGGYIFIRAPGGRGGNGGRGGDGQPGARGSSGRNATRFSSGGNGGPGGNGGNAGNPTDGADGGDGGDLHLIVDENDQGLLMLIKGDQSPGDGGFAGGAGKGGRGGPGGPGGSSYHWTETRRYTDSQGKRRSRTVFRSNPGGRKGRSGRNGAPSAYLAQDGRPGLAGRFQISVVGDDRSVNVYHSPYDLELVTFDLASEYTTLEPDSLISVDRLVIRNRGGMPTPPNYTVRIYLDHDRWIRPIGEDLLLQGSIAPGESYCFEQAGMRFRLGDFVIDQPRRRRFTVRHDVDPHAMMLSGINRPFRQFECAEEIHLRFPVELTPITALTSLAPGESTRVIWGVTNVGTETFRGTALDRAVRSQLRLLEGDVDRGHLVFFDHQDKPCDLTHDSFVMPIDELRPGDTKIIETRLGIEPHKDLVHYQGFAFGVDLDLQRPGSSDRPDEYRRVDYRKLFIRVSEPYLREADSRFLLIANEKTTTRDIENWTSLADYFGSSLDVWDISYYGFLDLIRAVDRDQSLLQQWRGMTVIIPNNYYRTPDGPTAAFSQLAKSQFLKAAADFDINFYIVGDARSGGADALQEALIPVDDARAPTKTHSRKAFLREVARWADYVERSREVVGGASRDVRELADVAMGSVHDLPIEKRTFLFQPDESWLKDHAVALQTRLRKIDPLHRWIIVYRYDSGDTDTSWGFFRKRKIGKLEVRRTLDASKGSAVLYEVDSIDAIDDNFINGEANKHGIFLALKFEDKVDRFIRLVSERTFPRYSEQYIDRPLSDQEVRQIGGELVDSLLTDLFNEQRVARDSRTWGRGGVEMLLPKLNYLAERALNYGVTYQQMEENPDTLQLLLELIANLRYMAIRSKTVWDSAWLPTSFFKRGRAVSTHMLERTDRIVTSIFGRKLSWWQRASSPGDDYDPFGGRKKKDAQAIERTIADQRLAKIEAELLRQNRSINHYATAQDHPGLVYDPELLTAESRVMSGQQFDELVAKEAQANVYRQWVENAVKEKRSDLLVPLAQPQTVATPSPQPTPKR